MPKPVKNPETSRPTMPFRLILTWTFIASGVLALGGVLLGKGDFSFGVVVGALLSCAGLLHMKHALRKSLSDPASKSPGPFLMASVLRWVAWAVVLFFLLKVSVACLLGAALAYGVYLASLAYHGFRHAPALPEGVQPQPYTDDDPPSSLL